MASDCSLLAWLSLCKASVIPAEEAAPDQGPWESGISLLIRTSLSERQRLWSSACSKKVVPAQEFQVCLPSKFNCLAAVPEGPCWYPHLPPGGETPAGKLPIESNLLLHFNSISIECGPAGGPGLWGMLPSAVSSLARESS